MRSVAERALRALVAIGCAWEVVAITTGLVPTVSAMTWSLVRTRRGRFLVWGLLGVLAWHLLGVGPLAQPREWAARTSDLPWFGVSLRVAGRSTRDASPGDLLTTDRRLP